jgi:hypothetical protein
MATQTFSRHGKTAEGQCSGTSYQNGWPGNCTRAAKEDGLCGQHLAGKHRKEERRRQSDASWERQREHYRRRDAQAAFVREWREAHPDEVFTDGWACPLCGQVIQTKNNHAIVPAVIRSHQDGHGADWLSYMAAGQPAPGGEGG